MASQLQSLWQGLLLANNPAAPSASCYWLLLETSQSFRLRQDQYCDSNAAAAAEQAAVYQRAGLRTPAENATRDWQAGPLWLALVAESLLRSSSSSLLNNPHDQLPPCRLIWLQTTGSHAARRRWLHTKQMENKGSGRFSVVDCCGSDPFGWDEENSKIANLERLDLLLKKIKNEVSTAAGANNKERLSIVVESLTPLLVRHGLERTVQFLTKISDEMQPAVLVLPVLVETLSTRQRQTLEDLSEASLLVSDGEAEMLRQGVREKGNRVREKLPFRINGAGDTASIELLEISSGVGGEQTAQMTNKSVDENEATNNAVSSLSISLENKTSKRSGKVQLQVDEGIRQQTVDATETQTSTSQPRIFMQDDDEEFADYDEEDPDDDLDL